MRTVNIAQLKEQLSEYVTFAKSGEEVVIRDRNLPVAKLVPFSSPDADGEELKLAAAGKLRLPETQLNIRALLKVRTGRVKGNKAIRAIIAEREEGALSMKKVNVHEAKTQLSKLLQRVAAGEEITIANRGVPVARLVPAIEPKAHRELGIERGHLKIAEDFDTPLPAHGLVAFLGGDKEPKSGGG